jgi:hypothetical protein
MFRPILDSDGEQSLVYYVPETAEADEAALRGMRVDQPETEEVSPVSLPCSLRCRLTSVRLLSV